MRDETWWITGKNSDYTLFAPEGRFVCSGSNQWTLLRTAWSKGAMVVECPNDDGQVKRYFAG